MEHKTIKRYEYLDLMKFIGIVFVLLYHLNIVPLNFIKNPGITTYINYSISSIMATCVPLFFFVNGFLLINKEFDLKKHLKKTFKLIIITVVWSFITLTCFVLIDGDRLSLYEFLKEIWTRGKMTHLWFMGALVVIYLVFPLIKMTYDHNRKIFNYFVLLCFVLTFVNSLLCMFTTVTDQFLLHTEAYVNRNYFNMFNPFAGLEANTFAYFTIGCFFAAEKDKIDIKISEKKFINKVTLSLTIVLSTICLSCWGILSSHFIHHKWDSIWYGYDNIFTLINVLCIYFISRSYKYNDKNLICKFILKVSQNTLGIYFIHVIFNSLFRHFGLNNIPFIDNYIAAIIVVFLIIILCLAVIYIMKKIPLIRHLVQI